jgi:hypothetical protein
MLFSFDANTVLEYPQSPNCTGLSVSGPLQTVCSGASVNGTASSFQAVKNTVKSSLAYNVTYYSDDKCTAGGYMLFSFPNLITSGVLNQCLYSQASLANKMMVAFDGTTYSFGFYDISGTCQGAPVSTKTYKAGACVAAPADSGSLGYMMVNSWNSVAPRRDLPAQLSGQVDLNSDAYNLNKQVVGASVGVLCGFTALLIMISMTGVLG